MLTKPLSSSHATMRASPPSARIAGRTLSSASSTRLCMSRFSFMWGDYIGVSEADSRISARLPVSRRRMNKDDRQTLLVIGAPEHDAAAYHLSGFLAPDPVICFRVADKKSYLAVSSMEYGRAKREAQTDEVLSFDELGVMNLAKELKSGGRALAAAAAALLEKLKIASSPIVVPPSLGVLYADELRARSLSVSPDTGLFASLRRSKTEEEISYIEKTQK